MSAWRDSVIEFLFYWLNLLSFHRVHLATCWLQCVVSRAFDCDWILRELEFLRRRGLHCEKPWSYTRVYWWRNENFLLKDGQKILWMNKGCPQHDSKLSGEYNICTQHVWICHFTYTCTVRLIAASRYRCLYLKVHLMPPKAFPNPLTFFTSLKVRLTLVPLLAMPSMNGCRLPRRDQLAIVPGPRSWSILTSLMPCKHCVYRSPVVISKLLGSWRILQPFASPLPSLGLTPSTICEPKLTVATTGWYASPSSCGWIPWPGRYSFVKQWFGVIWGDWWKTWSAASSRKGMESKRGMMGRESHSGKGASKSVLEGESGDGWAWRRRWLRCFQTGKGTVLIWNVW